uniref:Mitochondrial import receptor subunit TOM22 homolog n=1 Tax=Tabanus bromius TaxID=304241 RepID=A0A0K8TS13_TABBR
MDSDPDIEIVDKDSGMSSLGDSKDDTPERVAGGASATSGKSSLEVAEKVENYDDEPDETLSERLWGLTEMFPEPVRNVCGSVSDFSVATVKNVFQLSCNASWIFFTSSMILFAPVIFETERAQMEEMQRTQQKQVLLGPGSAMSSGGAPAFPALPPMAR